MAVAFDASATTDNTAGGGGSPITITNMTIGASGTALVVAFCAGINSGSLPTISSCTWNGVAMTQIGTKNQSDNLANVIVYGLQAPTTGNHNLVVTFSPTTGASLGVYIDCWSFSGTDTSSFANCFPSANVLTDASTPTGTTYPTTAFSVTTANGDAACAVMQCQVNQFPTTTGTLIRTDNAVNGNYSSAYKLATTTSTSLQFTGGASGSPAAGVAFRIQQPQSGATLMSQIWL